MNNLSVSVIVDGPLVESSWLRILQIQCQWSDLTPIRYGLYEPLRAKFDASRMKEIVRECWESDIVLPRLLWKGTRHAMGGSIGRCFSPMPEYARVPVWAHWSGPINDEFDFLGTFACRIAGEFGSPFGIVHLLADEEIERCLKNESSAIVPLSKQKRMFAIGATPMMLRSCIPDLFWGTIFGPPYVELFGKERLLSSPAFLVKEIGPEIVYIQLSESLRDMHGRFEHVDHVRRAVKEHLALDAFWRPGLPTDHPYVVPRILKEYGEYDE